MLGIIMKNVNIKNVLFLLLRDKNILLKRNNLPQIAFNIRSKQSMVSSKDECRLSEIDSDDRTEQPLKYSTSKAATMRVDEYRDPYGDEVPWYQPYSIIFSFSIFLIYFCILREENDIDLMLDNELGDSLKQSNNRLAEKKAKS
ncbi:uncharacterized protein LOC115243328 [Formica exsecta]|uniref:uncharacterized protein LOC115243328 n=1 Tax=Formica exsecta TaxID=72781 RepID=UPI001142B641|nr:uncharacterized protein LOC115243328 [Formica exsecta]